MLVLVLTGDRIQNPLAELSVGEMMEDVEHFANENQLNDILPDLKKGALVARDPAGFDSLPDLDDEEKRILRQEITHRWKQTRTLYVTIITCSVGAAVQGWDQTGILLLLSTTLVDLSDSSLGSNGANLSFPQAFGIGNGGSESAP